MQFLIYFEGYLFIADRPFGLNLYLGGNLPSHFFIVNIFYLFGDQGKSCTKFAPGQRYSRMRELFFLRGLVLHISNASAVPLRRTGKEPHDLGQVWSEPVALPGTSHRPLELTMSACREGQEVGGVVLCP
jgi:hypothetical protein